LKLSINVFSTGFPGRMKSSFQVARLRLDTKLGEVIADARMLATMKSQGIVVGDLPEGEIFADKTRLYQLFFNLLDNASKYAPEAGGT